MFILNHLDESYSEDCNSKRASWYTAKQNCQKKDLKLRSITTKINSRCNLEKHTYWIGNHIAEKIVWANSTCIIDFNTHPLLKK